MKTIIRQCVVAAFVLHIPALAQAQGCHGADDQSVRTISLINAIMVPKDTALRRKLQIPTVSPSQVILVTDSTVCTRGLAAVDSLIHATNPDAPNPIPTRNIYVITLGPSYYAMVDLGKAGEWQPVLFFTSLWAYLSSGMAN
jgi:hypothetical protein